MREIIIGGRSITVSHVETETTEYGDIQRYRIEVSGADAVTHLSSLRSSPNIDARVMASVIDTELLLAQGRMWVSVTARLWVGSVRWERSVGFSYF